MGAKSDRLAGLFLSDARQYLDRDLSRITSCLKQLSDAEIWWRPNEASNSVGNIVLHLCGNIRQWIISGLGGAKDVRARDLEFSERGPISRAALLARLRKTIREASAVLSRFPLDDFSREYRVQGFRITGVRAVNQVVEHLAYHTGQIVYITKMKQAKDLGLTKLPPYSPPKK